MNIIGRFARRKRRADFSLWSDNSIKSYDRSFDLVFRSADAKRAAAVTREARNGEEEREGSVGRTR